jgi:hypothetical protein
MRLESEIATLMMYHRKDFDLRSEVEEKLKTEILVKLQLKRDLDSLQANFNHLYDELERTRKLLADQTQSSHDSISTVPTDIIELQAKLVQLREENERLCNQLSTVRSQQGNEPKTSNESGKGIGVEVITKSKEDLTETPPTFEVLKTDSSPPKPKNQYEFEGPHSCSLELYETPESKKRCVISTTKQRNGLNKQNAKPLRFHQDEILKSQDTSSAHPIRRRTAIRKTIHLPKPRPVDKDFHAWAMEHNIDMGDYELKEVHQDLSYRIEFLQRRKVNEDQERFIIEHLPDNANKPNPHLLALTLLALFSYPFNIAFACLHCYSRLSHCALVRFIRRLLSNQVNIRV